VGVKPSYDYLEAWWSLDELSGNALDAFGANNLTETGGTIESEEGVVNGARKIALADTEYFSIADNPALSMGDIDFTIGGLVNLASLATEMGIIGKYNYSTSNREYLLEYSTATSRFVFIVSSDGTATATVVANNFGAPSDSVWHFVLCWHDSVNNTINIQVNNGLVDSVAHSAGVLNGASALNLGAFNGGFFLDGSMDETLVAKQVFTAEERTWLYNNSKGRGIQDLT